MSIDLDRATTVVPGAGNPSRPAETPSKLDEVPPGDSHLAACALHLLLAQHAELVDLPIRWEIDGGEVRPYIEHRHPEGLHMAQQLATALELPLTHHRMTANDGVLLDSFNTEGRWGGADWYLSGFALPAEDGEQP